MYTECKLFTWLLWKCPVTRSIETELFVSHHVGAHVRGSGLLAQSDAFVQIKNAIHLPRNNTSIVARLEFLQRLRKIVPQYE